MVSHWSFYGSEDSKIQLIKKMLLHNAGHCAGIFKHAIPRWAFGDLDILRWLEETVLFSNKRDILTQQLFVS